MTVSKEIYFIVGLFICFIPRNTLSKRYMSCAEGCCPYEFCAYGKICYPVLRCDVPCPDGSCENGLCMPTKPCVSDRKCPDAHECTTNFNLGYNTCQYNLDIGRTTCVDKNGHSVASSKPSSNLLRYWNSLPAVSRSGNTDKNVASIVCVCQRITQCMWRHQCR